MKFDKNSGYPLMIVKCIMKISYDNFFHNTLRFISYMNLNLHFISIIQ